MGLQLQKIFSYQSSEAKTFFSFFDTICSWLLSETNYWARWALAQTQHSHFFVLPVSVLTDIWIFSLRYLFVSGTVGRGFEISFELEERKSGFRNVVYKNR